MMITIIAILAVASAAAYIIYNNSLKEKCKWCKEKKKHVENGICEECLLKVQSREKQRIDRIIANYKIINSNRQMHIRLAKLDETMNELKKLFLYEDKGLTLIKPKAHKRFMGLKEIHDNIIFEGANEKIKSLKNKIKNDTDDKTRTSMYNQALLYIIDLKMRLIIKRTLLDELENELKNEILKLKVKSFVSDGIKYEKQGRRDDAIISYQKASSFIRENDRCHILRKDLQNINDRLKKIAA